MVLGIGIDLIEPSRIRRAVAREGWDFLNEFLRPSEVRRCRRAIRPMEAAALAFAAKEAFLKALGTGRSGKLSWHDLEVLGVGDGKRAAPSLVLSGEVRSVSQRLGVKSMHLSLTWAGPKENLAMATVLVEGIHPL